MNRTISKEKKEGKFINSSLKKTEKKRANHQDSSNISQYSNVWVQKKKVWPPLEQAKNTQIGILRNSSYCSFNVEKKYLQICTLLRLKGSRGRLFDWLLDVCRGFQLRWETYWCAIQIIDVQIFTWKSVTLQNIHLVGVASLFIATKIHEKVLPSLEAIVNNAVYNAFSEQDIVDKEAQIMLKNANSPKKPSYLSTVYNSLFEMYPTLSVKQRKQALRRLILIWVDPVTAFKVKQKTSKNNIVHVLYDDIVRAVVTNIKGKVQDSSFDEIRNYFKKEQQCTNFQPGWSGFDKMVL